jgi:hypothetical protein
MPIGPKLSRSLRELKKLVSPIKELQKSGNTNVLAQKDMDSSISKITNKKQPSVRK